VFIGVKELVKILFLIPLLIASLGLMLPGRAAAQTFTPLYNFTPFDPDNGGTNSDGAYPTASLILSGNTLYGTTGDGGTGGDGSVFAIYTDGLGFTNLYSFTVTSDSSPYSNSDGANPSAGLILSGNTLYGTAYFGGSSGEGTIFAVNTDGSGFTNLYSFTGGSDGANPNASLILSGDTLYGTASQGDVDNNGTVFAINTDGSGFTNLYNFTGGDGSDPSGGLILSGDTLYGTASRGGRSGEGMLFAINTDGTGFTNLYSFADSYDGANPACGLVLSGNTLYGTAENGGLTAYSGTVFSISINGTNFTILHDFVYDDGIEPAAGLVLSGNTLYGTTGAGGTGGSGTLFAVNTDSSGFTNLCNLSRSQAGLILSGNTLYGTTYYGGNNYGTVFSLTVPLPSAPQLAITLSGTNVVLTWSAAGFNLQSTTNLASPVVWSAVSGQNAVTNPISGMQMFFRLSQ